MNSLSLPNTLTNEGQIKDWINQLSLQLLNETSIPPTYLDLFENSLNLAENTIWQKLSTKQHISKTDIQNCQTLHHEICKYDYQLARYLLRQGNSTPLPWYFSKFKYHITPEGLIAIKQAPEDSPER